MHMGWKQKKHKPSRCGVVRFEIWYS